MYVAAEAGYLESPDGPHRAGPLAVEEGRLPRIVVKMAEREVYSARRFHKVARHFYFKEQRLLVREKVRLDIPYPRLPPAHDRKDREPHGHRPHHPCEGKEKKVGYLLCENAQKA